MKIVIRAADLESDREVLIEALLKYLTPLSSPLRFDWLYRANPFGPARAWLAVDADRDMIVGVAAAFPRRMYVGSQEELAWVLGDFCIHDRYRSLGPALQLQRACLGEIDSGAMALCYDFPSTSMMAVFQRLKVPPFGKMVRYAKPLRIDRKIREYVKVPLGATVLSALGNPIFSFWNRLPKGDKAYTYSLELGDFGEEYSVLAQKAGPGFGVCTVRSAAYLNWRYVANPLNRYEVLAARREGELLGYAVFMQTGEDADLVDVFGVNETPAIRGVVSAVLSLLKSRGVMTVSAPMLATHVWVAVFQGLGFREREAAPVVVYPSPRLSAEGHRVQDLNWFLMQGDRDS